MNITKCALALTLGAIAAVSANGETADTHTGVVAANPEDAVKKQARSVHLTYLGLPPKMIAAAAITPRSTPAMKAIRTRTGTASGRLWLLSGTCCPSKRTTPR